MILSIDLGATNVKYALFDEKLKKRSETYSVPTCAGKGRAGIEAALGKIVKDNLPAEYIAVSSAGDVDKKAAKITYATENLPGMTGFNYAEFAKSFNLSAYAVNDAQAALLGEVYCGCAKNYRDKNVAMLTLGSGVGGAYFSRGRLVSNEKNGFARFGHIALHGGGYPCTCGKSGCVETYLSGRAIHRLAAERGIDGDDIFARYLSGEKPYVEFINDFKKDLSLALDLIYETGPFDVCIIGGGVADWMGESFDKIASGLVYPLVKAELGNDAGVYGACVHAKIMRGEL